MPPGDPRSVSLNASYHKEQQYIQFKGLGIWTVSEILGLLWSEGVGHAPCGPFETPLQNFLTIPIISEQSVHWLPRTCPDKIWADFGMPQGTLWVGHFEFWNPFAQLQIRIYHIPKFQTNGWVVNENTSGQKLGRKRKDKRPMGHDSLTR